MRHLRRIIQSRRGSAWCAGATICCALAWSFPAGAATLSERAKESGCVNKPVSIGRMTYRCFTESGTPSYFNFERAGDPEPQDKAVRRNGAAPSPAGFPKVDPATQKGRDEVRRKVLSDELATEEKLLVEARVGYADGAPTALPEERANVEKYRERIAKLRQAVGVHERNIEALKKELTAGK
jgi:hypothetical protein